MSLSIETVSECPICYVAIGDRNKCITECGHEFCLKCMLSWSQMNVSCPCCREELIEVSTEEDEEDEDESLRTDSSAEDEEEDEDDDDGTNASGHICTTGASVENIAKMFERKGYTLSDAITLMLGRHSDQESKNSPEYYYEMLGYFDDIVESLDDEADSESSEREQMGEEDTPPVVDESVVDESVAVVVSIVSV